MAHRHPPYPLADSQKIGVICRLRSLGKLIHVYAALEADASASRLFSLHKRAMQTNSEGDALALWDGFYTIRRKAEECVEDARECGCLLFCWSGTKALEGALSAGGAA